ncbi:MAG: sulfotransferase [Actinomycetota bacterium]
MVLTIQRRVHIIGCGMPKSGTTSLARMLSRVLRARHEFEMDEAARVHLLQQRGEMTSEQVDEWLVGRDERCNAEVDSTSFLWTWADRLPSVFPEARFVATVREPHDWCRSLAGMLLAMGTVSDDHMVWAESTGAGDVGNRPLDNPLDFLTAGMGYWRQSALAIGSLPPQRTWWCRTSDLSARADDLARWAGVHPDWLRREPANQAVIPLADVQSALADEWVAAAVTHEDEAVWRSLGDLADRA